MRCPTCGFAVPSGGAACPTCHPPVPPGARDGPAAPSGGERRRLTIVFADLVASTDLVARMDPEEWRDVVTMYFRAVAAAIEGAGGHVVKYLGDGVMACFGHPRAYGDDAERAVRAALAVVDEVRALDRWLEATRGVRLSVRVGVHTGASVVGEGGGGLVDVFGDAPHIASRVQSLAAPDSVLISADTNHLLTGLFVTDDLGEHALKGVPDPLRLYRVHAPSGARGRLEAAMARGLTPFVDREAEQHMLRERWERARNGEGQVVLIVGEPGIGKSRLVHRFRESLGDEPHAWIEGHCSPHQQGTPFAPIIDLLRQQLGGSDDPRDRLRRLGDALDRARRRDDVPMVAELLGLEAGDRHAPLLVAPAEARRRLLAALSGWLSDTARQQPVVLVLEDLQWMDPSTAELLDILADQAAVVPLLVLGTARREFQPSWRPRAHHLQLTLQRLTAAQTRRVVSLVAAKSARGDPPAEGTAATAPSLLDLLAERADGVPLFAEELTKAVVDAQRRQDLDIPMTLHDSLMARLDALGPAKELAQVASVVGRKFSYALLRAVTGLDADLLGRHLDRIVDAEIVSVRGVAPDAVYTFRHALVRDAAYDSLLKRRRRELHHTIADTLREKDREAAGTPPELVAFHYVEAGLVAEAIPHLRRAGERAVASAANREAVQHLTRALDLLATLPASPERDTIELSLLLPLGVAWMAVQGYAAPETERAFARAHTLCRGLGETPALVPILSGLLTFAVVRAELARAREIGEQLLAMAQRTADGALLANAHLRLAVVCEYEGRPRDARSHAEECLARSTESEAVPAGYSESPITAAGAYRALALWRLGYPDQALAAASDAVERARRMNHPLSLAQALILALQVRVYRREWEVAREEAAAAIDFCTEKGFPLWAIAGAVHHGGILAELGRVEEAVVQVERGIAEWRATGARVGSAVFFTMLARCYARAGRVGDGLRVVAEALAMTAETGERSEDAELHRLHGELLLQTPDAASGAAEAALLRGLRVAREQGARAWELRAAISLGRLWQHGARRHEALRLLADLEAQFDEGRETPDLRDATAMVAVLT